MTAALASIHAPAFRSPIAGLRERQPALAAVGIAYLILAVVVAVLPVFDARQLDGVSVWAKPAKFFLSSGVLILTSAWFYGYVRPERRRTPALRASASVLIACALFELAYITFQAAQGERSHFNDSDLTHHALYAMMGLAALAMLATKIPLAIEIARRPAVGMDATLRLAVVAGLLLTAVLGALSGLYMGQQYGTGHNVGAVGGAAPLFGWNRAGGDLRVAHFFGMHAEQVLPVVAVLSGGLLGAVWARRLTMAAGVAIVAMTVAVFVQALMGRPFPTG